MKRKVTDLKPNEAILISNDEERDAILQLMEDAGMRWNGNQSAFRYIPDVNYDYCLTYKSEGNNGIVVLLNYSRKYEGFIVLPATDFIGSEWERVEASDSKLNAFIRAKVDWYESMQDYQVATDSIRCWLDEFEAPKSEPIELTRNTNTDESH